MYRNKKHLKLTEFSLCAILLFHFLPLTVFGEVPYTYIRFDDLVPSDRTLTQCWDHIGIDNQERIYIGFTSNCSGSDLEDVCMFRYNPGNGKREFLGTYMAVAKNAQNYETGESLPKGHTDIVTIDGTLYMGTQGFHDWKGEIYNISPSLNDYRGGHLYTFNPLSDTWDDASKSLPGGVVIEHEGIICIEYMPWNDLLVALTHPLSTIILFDYENNTVIRKVSGIPWQLGNPLSRELVVTRTGKIYTYRGTEDPEDRDKSFNIWVYDIATDKQSETTFKCSNGFWDGQAKTHDGNHIYVSSCNGNLYHLDVERDEWESTGQFLPEESYSRGERLTYLYGICFSPDESCIYGIASQSKQLTGNLYMYDCVSGKVTFIQNIGNNGCFTGNDVRDSQGNIYFAHHGSAQDGWNGNCSLLKITVSEPLSVPSDHFRTPSGDKINHSIPQKSYLLNGRITSAPNRYKKYQHIHNRILTPKN